VRVGYVCVVCVCVCMYAYDDACSILLFVFHLEGGGCLHHINVNVVRSDLMEVFS